MAENGDLEGANELKLALRRAVDKVPNEVGAALYSEALIVEKVSRGRTPVLTGALRASHQTGDPERVSDGVQVLIQVGGPAIPYAVRVHYDLEARHRVGQALFLESAVLEARPQLAERVAGRIDVRRFML